MEMNKLLENMLRSTVLDNEMELNRGNCGIMKSLSKSFRRYFHLKYKEKMTTFLSKIQAKDEGGPFPPIFRNSKRGLSSKNKSQKLSESTSHPTVEIDVSKTDDFIFSDFLLSLIHISEPTRPERISYAVFCLKKKK